MRLTTCTGIDGIVLGVAAKERVGWVRVQTAELARLRGIAERAARLAAGGGPPAVPTCGIGEWVLTGSAGPEPPFHDRHG
ncbi:hypothetical protein ACQEVB_20970 [Pseudonocardia sp. CA-107938]|uniref:hypothetical protein n=1 Tax=Pseudonocardia sp. CA-107938 TaxID=3240021 RepID=UPI003D8E07AF